MAEEREMLDRWSDRSDDRMTIVEFWEWLVKHCHEDEEVLNVNVEKMIDDFHQIDRCQLDGERRALLDSIATG